MDGERGNPIAESSASIIGGRSDVCKNRKAGLFNPAFPTHSTLEQNHLMRPRIVNTPISYQNPCPHPVTSTGDKGKLQTSSSKPERISRLQILLGGSARPHGRILAVICLKF